MNNLMLGFGLGFVAAVRQFGVTTRTLQNWLAGYPDTFTTQSACQISDVHEER
jgi:hypothetical protein